MSQREHFDLSIKDSHTEDFKQVGNYLPIQIELEPIDLDDFLSDILLRYFGMIIIKQ